MSTTLVYKFGGASVKDAPALKNLYDILLPRLQTNTVIVVSAMGKTTNALEAILTKKLAGEDYTSEWNTLKTFHKGLCAELFPESHPVGEQLEGFFVEALEALQ